MRIHMLASAAKYIGGFLLNAPAHRFSFHDNESIDDVSEKFFSYPVNGTTFVPYSSASDNKLNVSNSTTGTPMANDFAPRAGKPFSMQCKFNLASIDSAFKAAVIAKWSESDANERSWALFIYDDGRIIFSISEDGTADTTLNVVSAFGLVSLNQDYHVAVERDSNDLISIYLNGIRVASVTDSRGAYRNSATVFGVRRGGVGKVWDIQLDHRSVFNGEFAGKIPGKFGKPAKYTGEFYTEAEASDIIYQMSGRRSSSANEVNGAPMALIKSNMYNGRLFVSGLASASYFAWIDYFGAADFTMECKYLPEAIPAGDGVLLMSHWHNGNQTHANNRWIIIHLPNGAIQVVFARSQTAGDYTAHTTQAGLLTTGRRYHVVVERYNGTIKLFVNGIERLSWLQPEPLWAGSGNAIRNVYGGSGYGQHRIWDMRIAKRAMYQHNAPAWADRFPKMPLDWRSLKTPHLLITGSNDVASGTVTYKGFAKNLQYGLSTISFGELPHELYYNTDTGKVMRIVAIMYQSNSYVVLGLKESSEPYSPEMPTMTNRIKIAGGQTFDWTTGIVSTAANDPTVILKHFGSNNVGNVGTAFASDEVEVPFSFV